MAVDFSVVVIWSKHKFSTCKTRCAQTRRYESSVTGPREIYIKWKLRHRQALLWEPWQRASRSCLSCLSDTMMLLNNTTTMWLQFLNQIFLSFPFLIWFLSNKTKLFMLLEHKIMFYNKFLFYGDLSYFLMILLRRKLHLWDVLVLNLQ